MLMRVCKKCGADKPIDQFVPNKKCRDGRTRTCKECCNAANRKRFITKNPERAQKRQEAKDLFGKDLKRCVRCTDVKPLSSFWQCKSRWSSRGGYAPHCKECATTNNAEWRRKNQERRAAYYAEYEARPERIAQQKRNKKIRAANSPRSVMQVTLRHGLRRHTTETPATIDDLMKMWQDQNGRCALTNIPMTWAQGAVLPTSISLDRIDPRLGYSKDNLRLICHAVNAFKGRMTDEQMLSMARAIVAKADTDSREPTWNPHVIQSEAA